MHVYFVTWMGQLHACHAQLLWFEDLLPDVLMQCMRVLCLYYLHLCCRDASECMRNFVCSFACNLS